MRIRKGKVPLPISLLSPVPISDPNLFSRLPVTVQDQVPNQPLDSTHPQPSDHLGLTSSSSDLRRLLLEDAIKQPQLLCLGFPGGEKKLENNDVRGENKLYSTTIVAPSENNNHSSPLSSQATCWKWGNGERVVPVKKRARGSSLLEIETQKMKDKIFGTDIKDLEEDQKDNNTLDRAVAITDERDRNIPKKVGGGKRRGSTIMEGSRCSRVNGRGWRCCQPTLVGYSLCEHHLGKGRLRSITTVRGRSSTSKKATHVSPVLDGHKVDHNVQVKQAAVTVNSIGKRVKLGVVKARSLSSLLGQTTNATVVDDHDHDHNVELNVMNEEKRDYHMLKEEQS